MKIYIYIGDTTQNLPSHTLLSVCGKYKCFYFSLFTPVITFCTHCSACYFVHLIYVDDTYFNS